MTGKHFKNTQIEDDCKLKDDVENISGRTIELRTMLALEDIAESLKTLSGRDKYIF